MRSILLRAPRGWQRRSVRWFVLGAVALMAYGLGQCSNDQEVAYWKGRVDTQLAQNAAVNKRADSLQKVITKQVSADSLKADSIAHLQARIHERHQGRNAVISTLPDTCKTVVAPILADTDSLDAGLTDARAIIARQLAAVALLNRTVDDLQAQNDTLVHLLKTVPKSKKPSRWSLGLGIGECAGATIGPCFMLGATYRLFP